MITLGLFVCVQSTTTLKPLICEGNAVEYVRWVAMQRTYIEAGRSTVLQTALSYCKAIS